MSPVATALGSVGRAVGAFHPGSVPRLSRGYYRREMIAWMFLPVMMGAVEGGVVGVIAKNAFAGAVPDVWLNAAVAVLTGAPALANVTSLVWASLSQGRHKIRFLVGLQLASVVLVGQVAFAPANGTGLVMLLLAALGARTCWAGVVTVRSTVWRANYPPAIRAAMAGRLATVQAVVLAATGLVLALALRHDAQAYRLLYPISAVIGVVGVFVYGRMRVRGHAVLRSDERRDGTLYTGRRRLPIVRILREDRHFRRYMACMFVFGIGNIAVTAPLVIMLRDTFGYGYLNGILITTCIPIILMPLAIPLWAGFLDRTHIIRFRVYHAWSFVLTNALVLAAALLTAPALLWIAAAAKGIAFGGGVLGWNLGHHDFAPLERASQYMGVHATLTGVRGLIGPLGAVALYETLEAGRPGAGGWVFAVCLALNLAGAAGFAWLDRVHRREHGSSRRTG